MIYIHKHIYHNEDVKAISYKRMALLKKNSSETKQNGTFFYMPDLEKGACLCHLWLHACSPTNV